MSRQKLHLIYNLLYQWLLLLCLEPQHKITFLSYFQYKNQQRFLYISELLRAIQLHLVIQTSRQTALRGEIMAEKSGSCRWAYESNIPLVSSVMHARHSCCPHNAKLNFISSRKYSFGKLVAELRQGMWETRH